MSDIIEARKTFKKAGLAFPKIPKELAPRLKKRDEWLYSTREIEIWPYWLDEYMGERYAEDYAIISHSGHGVNSYAIQYYLVYKSLRMFLFLGWGGAYGDEAEDAAQIRDCFSLADQIIAEVKTTGKLQDGDIIFIVVSDFYGSYWSPNGKELQRQFPQTRSERIRMLSDSRSPAEILSEVLSWLTSGEMLSGSSPARPYNEHLRSGNDYMKLNKFEDAASEYQKAIEIKPGKLGTRLKIE